MRSKGNGIHLLENCEGKGLLGCLFVIVLLGAMAFFAVQAGPPYFAFRGLEGDVKAEISRAGAHLYTDEVIVKNIMDLAKKNDVPIKTKDIKLDRVAGQIQVEIHYTVPVDFILFEHTFSYDIRAASFVGRL